jgi:glycerophosphoryl diester phosphodiesterase
VQAPEVIAHRGFTRDHPENSLAAFEAAAGLRAGGIELDVHSTSDGVLVVHHDSVLDHRVSSPVSISAVTLHELRARESHSSPIPTLADVVLRLSGLLRVYVEIKAPHIERLVCDVLRPHVGSCAIHSFDHRTIAGARAIAPEIPRGVLMSSYLLDPTAPLRATDARDLWQQWEMIDAELVRSVHSYGGRVIAWTINDAHEARKLIALGVDGLCTDRSDEMLRLVEAAS